MGTSKLLRRKAASEYLHDAHGLDRAPATLAKLAVSGGGPVFRRIGRVPLYAPCDLDDWVTSQLGPRMQSTSHTAPKGTAGEQAAYEPHSGLITTAEAQNIERASADN